MKIYNFTIITKLSQNEMVKAFVNGECRKCGLPPSKGRFILDELYKNNIVLQFICPVKDLPHLYNLSVDTSNNLVKGYIDFNMTGLYIWSILVGGVIIYNFDYFVFTLILLFPFLILALIIILIEIEFTKSIVRCIVILLQGELLLERYKMNHKEKIK